MGECGCEVLFCVRDEVSGVAVDLVILLASQGENRKLADEIGELCKLQNIQSHCVDLVALELPLFSSHHEKSQGLPEKASQLTELLVSSAALVVVSPEYNGGIPPSFVNAVSWVSRSVKGDWRAGFKNKPTLLCTASSGSGSGVRTALRLQLSYLGAHVLGRTVSVRLEGDNLKSTLEASVKELCFLAQLKVKS